MATATANTNWGSFGQGRIISCSVTIPMYGTWVADVVMALGTAFTPTSKLTLGDLTLLGSVQRAASFAGSRSARIVGGYTGWQKPVASRGYSLPAGVPFSMVLKDTANEVGEKLGSFTDSLLGPFFVREAGPASRVLRQLAGPLWWVDSTGLTQIQSVRQSTPIALPFEVIEWSGAKGKFVIATERLSDWMPGRTFTSPTVTTPQTVAMTTITVSNEGKARLEVLVTP